MTGYIRAPRVLIACDVGTFFPIECEVSVSTHQSADKFHALLSLDVPSAGAWDTSSINVTVMATNDENTGGYVQMFTGAVDKIKMDFGRRTVEISGRDKTAQMTDQKTTEKWLNKKPEDIITDLAGRAGLGVQIQGSSQDKAGLKYKDDYNKISEYDNWWNVVVRMAKSMGCIAFVKGSTLMVQPFNFTQGVFTINYTPPSPGNPASATVIELVGERDINLSKNVKVNHKSWQHKEGKQIESEFTSGGGGSGTLEYTFAAANMTKAQQDQLAQSKLNEIMQHERKIEVHTYGDVSIDPSMALQVTGTGTGFDQQYIISTIDHYWSEDDGYKMNISARNQDGGRGGASQGM